MTPANQAPSAVAMEIANEIACSAVSDRTVRVVLATGAARIDTAIAAAVAAEREACKRDATLAWEQFGGDSRFIANLECRIFARSNQ